MELGVAILVSFLIFLRELRLNELLDNVVGRRSIVGVILKAIANDLNNDRVTPRVVEVGKFDSLQKTKREVSRYRLHGVSGFVQ